MSNENINRRTFFQLGSAAAVAAGTAAARPPQRARERPNILFLMADQHRGDCLGADGNRAIHTPNLDRLAVEGARFSSAYSSTPSCTPARAALLTGKSPWNHGMLGYGRVAEQYPVEKPQALRRGLVAGGPRDDGGVAERAEALGDGRREVDEQVELASVVGARDLGAGEQVDLVAVDLARTRLERGREVVVGQRDDLEPAPGTPRQHLLLREPTIGPIGVEVEVEARAWKKGPHSNLGRISLLADGLTSQEFRRSGT